MFHSFDFANPNQTILHVYSLSLLCAISLTTSTYDLEKEIEKDTSLMKFVNQTGSRLSSLLNDHCSRLSESARMEEKYLLKLVEDEHIEWKADTSYDSLSQSVKEVAERIRQSHEKDKKNDVVVEQKDGKEEKGREEYAITWCKLEAKRPAICRWTFGRIQRKVGDYLYGRGILKIMA